MTGTSTQRLDRAACDALLRSAAIGRIALRHGRDVVVAPVQLGFLDDDVVYLAPPGPLLDAAVMGTRVTLEADGTDRDGNAWSVVASGFAEELTDPRDQQRVAQLDLETWSGEPCDHVVRVRCERVTGARGASAVIDLSGSEVSSTTDSRVAREQRS